MALLLHGFHEGGLLFGRDAPEDAIGVDEFTDFFDGDVGKGYGLMGARNPDLLGDAGNGHRIIPGDDLDGDAVIDEPLDVFGRVFLDGVP